MPRKTPSPKAPGLILHDSLLASAWVKTGASEHGAYMRNGDAFLTWRSAGVTIATSGTSKVYDAERGVVMTCMGHGCEATIEALIVDPSQRSRGLARSALAAWVSKATKAGVTLYIEPVPLEDGIDRERLIRFYESLGFRKTDPAFRVMVRTP